MSQHYSSVGIGHFTKGTDNEMQSRVQIILFQYGDLNYAYR